MIAVLTNAHYLAKFLEISLEFHIFLSALHHNKIQITLAVWTL